MAKLTKEFKQLKKGSQLLTGSEIIITVEFDPSTREVEKIISVESFCYKRGIFTDITHIMSEHFHESLDRQVDDTDWSEIYADREADVFLEN